MKEENISFNYKKNKISIKARVCNPLKEATGLMFTRRQSAKPLLFNVKKPIALHSVFVFFPFITVWLKDNKVVEVKEVKPFTLHIKPKKQFNKILEIPINNRYKKITRKLKS